MSSSQNSNTTPLEPISDNEAKFYYYGLHSKPVLVARTGTDTWMPPTGPEAYHKPKQLRSVGNHILQDIWEDIIAPQIHDILDAKGVMWTSTDVARIGFTGKSIAPVYIWIGVKPSTLSRLDGLNVALECKQVLVANSIHDVEVEIRESVVTRYIGPKLHKPVPPSDPTAQLLEPLTSTLGLSICEASSNYAEGTGGFFVTDCADKSILYLVTARHVVFPDMTENEIYEYKSTYQRRINVALLGDHGFNNYIQKIQQAITDQKMIIQFQETRISNAKQGGDGLGYQVGQALRELEVSKRDLQEAKNTLDAFSILENAVVKNWSGITNRILGYVQFAPPIQLKAGLKEYTQDYALIRIDRSKIDHTNCTGNAIDLGTQIPPHEFRKLMIPNIQNSHHFQYPPGRLLPVRGIIPDSEMRSPTIMDENGEMCLVVMKRGHATGLTVGHSNSIKSYVRNYFHNSPTNTSMEWAIYTPKKGAFSAEGDSGSGIVDCLGRLGGLLTGGGGYSENSDITYATPISFILDSLKTYGYHVTTEATLTV